MADFFVYILACADHSFYVGHTDNMFQRMDQHYNGKISGYTSTRRPVKLVWNQQFQSRDAAFIVERRIKGWIRAKKQALIDGNWELLQELALCTEKKHHE